jgi:hypothetical protein
MPTYSEVDIQNAIQAVLDGKSIRKAAQIHGIPYGTLHGRCLGTEARTHAHETQQRLSPSQEKQLVDWILAQEALGYAPSHGQVKGVVSRLLKVGGDEASLGRHWMEGLYRRNPQVKTKIGKRIDYTRVKEATPANINKFFDLLETVSYVKPENIWNADEAGIMEGMGLNGLVVRSSQVNPKSVPIKGNQNRAWTSFVECINAQGRSLTPLVIFKAASIQHQWFANDLDENWQITYSENGWTSNDINQEWLERIFIPETQFLLADESDIRLLVVDGHGSHTTDDFMFTCFSNNIYLLFLPAHTSHILQPLDLGIFSPLKRAYRRFLAELDSLTDSAPIGKLNFLRCLSKARKQAITRRNILSGWRATGIWPIQRNKPLHSSRILPPRPPPLTPPLPPNPPYLRPLPQSVVRRL